MRKFKKIILHLFSFDFYKSWQSAIAARIGVYQAHDGCPVLFRGVYLFVSVQVFKFKLELRIFFLPNLLEERIRENIRTDDRTCGAQWWINPFWEGRT